MYVFSGYGIAFDGADSWSFGNDLARNVQLYISYIFSNNRKKNFLGLGEGPVNDINGTFGFSEKKVGINFDKAIIL